MSTRWGERSSTGLSRTAELLTDLENEVLSVLDRDRIMIPDDISGQHGALSAAVALGSRPTLVDNVRR